MKVHHHLRVTLRFINVMLLLILLLISGSWNHKVSDVRTERTFQIFLGRKKVGYLNIVHTRGAEKSRIQVFSGVERRKGHKAGRPGCWDAGKLSLVEFSTIFLFYKV